MKIKAKILLLVSFITLGLTVLILNILVNTRTIYSYEVNRIQTKEKVVMLTFDDGPLVPADDEILDILEKEKVSGMFFQIGRHINQRLHNPNENISKQYLAVQKRILTGSSFSWIGNHTYHHANYINKQKWAIEDLTQTQTLLQQIYKQILNININPELVPTRWSYLQYFNGMDYIAQQTNNKYFIRGYLGTDYKEAKTGKHKIIAQYLSHLHPGQIFVCHTRNYAKEWLPELIKIIKSKGYKFASFNPYSPNYYKKFGKLVP